MSLLKKEIKNIDFCVGHEKKQTGKNINGIIKHVCKIEGIFTLEELLLISEDDFLSFDKVGKGVLSVVKGFLSVNDLSFGMCIKLRKTNEEIIYYLNKAKKKVSSMIGDYDTELGCCLNNLEYGEERGVDIRKIFNYTEESLRRIRKQIRDFEAEFNPYMLEIYEEIMRRT